MDARYRSLFNQVASPELFERYKKQLTDQVGPFPFRVAETPLFVDEELQARLSGDAEAIVTELSEPSVLAELKKAIPPAYDVPGMDPLPDCVQVDFALVRGDDGKIQGRLVELQAFPSLYALESIMADCWSHTISEHPGLDLDWQCFFGLSRTDAIAWMKRVVVGDTDPREVVLVDYEPETQKTVPDFHATKVLFDVDSVCVTKLIREGRKLFRDVGGKRIPVRRIYNRMVFDELEVKNVHPPFGWNEELDVTWCSHPNWYWAWSKYSLPFLRHPSVPRSRFLSDVLSSADGLPGDLERYVLKPLFSFAGSGVVIDVTKEAVHRIPDADRPRYILQEKVTYEGVVPMPPNVPGFDPSAPNVKAEVRVMVLRHALTGPRPLRALLCLVRMSRGRMLGVDQNRSADSAWSGGSVGLWPKR